MSKEEKEAACRDAATQFAVCVETKSPCVAAGGTIVQCVKRKEFGDGCEALHRSYFECRRSQLDMRTRIRGKKFQDFGAKEDE